MANSRLHLLSRNDVIKLRITLAILKKNHKNKGMIIIDTPLLPPLSRLFSSLLSPLLSSPPKLKSLIPWEPIQSLYTHTGKITH
jgi:hypothetical protein